MMQPDAGLLVGKVALVTGAAQGIGRSIALALAAEGWVVAVNDLAEVLGESDVVGEIQSRGAQAFAISADIRSSPAVRDMFAVLDERLGRIDLLVNNAAAQTLAPLLELDEEAWDRMMATNLRGAFLCMQAAARRMKQAGGGAIIHIGSGSSKVPFPGLGAYSVSKAGLDMLTKCAAVELGQYGIRVNCVAPGAVLVERTEKDDPEYGPRWARQAPLGRVGVPEDVAQAVVFFASERASFMTGQTVWVDGGAFTKPDWPYR